MENIDINMNEIPIPIIPIEISNIENVIIEKENKCALNLDKFYEYKEFFAISLIYLFKQFI